MIPAILYSCEDQMRWCIWKHDTLVVFKQLNIDSYNYYTWIMTLIDELFKTSYFSFLVDLEKSDCSIVRLLNSV